MNDVKSLQILEARVAKLERAARRWMAGCFAVMVLACGMGAKFAVMDAEFNIVKAERFEVVGSGGKVLATFGRLKEVDRESSAMVLDTSDEKFSTIISAGGNPIATKQ